MTVERRLYLHGILLLDASMTVFSTSSHGTPLCSQKSLERLGMRVCKCSVSIQIVDQWFSPQRCLAERYASKLAGLKNVLVWCVAQSSKRSVIVMVFRQHCAVQGRSFEHFFMFAIPLALHCHVTVLSTRGHPPFNSSSRLRFLLRPSFTGGVQSHPSRSHTLTRAFAFGDK